MTKGTELRIAKQWNLRLSLLVAVLVLGALILNRSYTEKIRELEKTHYVTAMQMSELYKSYVDQKIFYVEFLVNQEILDPNELESAYAEQSQIIRKEKERMSLLRAKYHIPVPR